MTVRKQIIGWKEVVNLPDLGISGLVAKIDTGARTSALHVDALERFAESDGTSWVRFQIGRPKVNNGIVRTFTAPLFDSRAVKSSNGVSERRHVIHTTLVLGQRSGVIEITLTSREAMRYPMLVSRTALRRGFLVDPARSFLLGKQDNSAARSR